MDQTPWLFGTVPADMVTGRIRRSKEQIHRAQRYKEHIPTLINPSKPSCRVLEHLWLREQPASPQRCCSHPGRVCAPPLCTAHCRAPGGGSWLGQGRQGRCHTRRCHISLSGAPLSQGTAFILSHPSVGGTWGVATSLSPKQGRHHMELLFPPLSSHLPQKKSTKNCTVQSKQNSSLSIAREKMSAHTSDVSKCKYQCSICSKMHIYTDLQHRIKSLTP